MRAGYRLDEFIATFARVSSLLRNPTLAIAGVSTIALGVGVNTTVFSIVNGRSSVHSR